MRAISPNKGAASAVNHWSRMLGVTLRPWSGHAPWWLILRGIIQLAVCLLFMRLTQQFMSSAIAAGLDAEHPSLRSGGALLMVVLIILAVLAAARTLVGLIDLVPRRVVKGTVLSVRERRVGDMLPRLPSEQSSCAVGQAWIVGGFAPKLCCRPRKASANGPCATRASVGNCGMHDRCN